MANSSVTLVELDPRTHPAIQRFIGELQPNLRPLFEDYARRYVEAGEIVGTAVAEMVHKLQGESNWIDQEDSEQLCKELLEKIPIRGKSDYELVMKLYFPIEEWADLHPLDLALECLRLAAMFSALGNRDAMKDCRAELAEIQNDLRSPVFALVDSGGA